MSESVPPTSRAVPRASGDDVGAHWPRSLMEALRMEIVEQSPSLTVITMPVEGNTQPHGILHGGASAALAETAASCAAQLHARRVHGPEHGVAVGIELSISHISRAERGLVTAVARAVHLGHSQTVHLVDICNEDGSLVSTARVTNRILTHH